VKALGDVKDFAVLAVAGFVAWLVYKLFKGFAPAEPVVATVTTSDGKNIRISGRIIKPADGGQAELGTSWRDLLNRTYAAEAEITNRGDSAVTFNLLFETQIFATGVSSDSVSSCSVPVSLTPGQSKIVKHGVPINVPMLWNADSPALMRLYAVAGGEKQPIGMSVRFTLS
jgi:hypothetical protein